MHRTASRLFWVLPLAAMAVGVLIVLWPAGPAETVPPAGTPAAKRAAAAPGSLLTASSAATAVRASARIGAAAEAADADPLQSLSPEERRALAAALATHPSRDVEMRRIASFLRLQRDVQAWGAARAARADPAQRRDLAARIEAALPAAVDAGSLTAGEALQVQSGLIAEREPDTARAEAELAAWRTRHLRTTTGPDDREREFLAQQQALVTAYQGRPEQLEPALEALRRQYFTAPSAH